MTLRVGIYIYPDVEVLDFAGPYEVFSTASRVTCRKDPAATLPFAVSLLAATREPVRARAGFTVVPDQALADHPPLDVLILPGGVHEPELERPWPRHEPADGGSAGVAGVG
jgi:putative intracellular protease/amidase